MPGNQQRLKEEIVPLITTTWSWLWFYRVSSLNGELSCRFILNGQISEWHRSAHWTLGRKRVFPKMSNHSLQLWNGGKVSFHLQHRYFLVYFYCGSAVNCLCWPWHYTHQEEVNWKLNFCQQPGKLEHFIQIVSGFLCHVFYLTIEEIKKHHTVMCNVLAVSFAENGKSVYSWARAHTCKCVYVWQCQQAYVPYVCVGTSTFELVRVIYVCQRVCTCETAQRERAGVCQHVNWKGFIFAALLPGRKRGSGHRCEVWLMDVLPW